MVIYSNVHLRESFPSLYKAKASYESTQSMPSTVVEWHNQGNCRRQVRYYFDTLERRRTVPGRCHTCAGHSTTFSEPPVLVRCALASLTLHPCSTRNARAEDRSCMLCVGSGLGLLLLLVSMRGAGAGRAVAVCSLCVWRRCGTSWRGCWLAIPLTGAGRCALRRIVDVNQRLESQTNQTQAIPHAKRTNIHPFMSIQLPTQARRPNLA